MVQWPICRGGWGDSDNRHGQYVLTQPRLQTLENLGDLALEPWDNLFPRQCIVRLQFGDGAIRAVYLDAMRVRVDDPDELDASSQPLHNFCF